MRTTPHLAGVSTESYTRHMTPTLADFMKMGYALTPEERLQAARLLRLSVDEDVETDPTEIEAEWRDVIACRVDDVVNGRVDLVDADETYRILSAELARKTQ